MLGTARGWTAAERASIATHRCGLDDTSLLGHGYFAARSELLIDIEEVLEGLEPDRRKTIRRTVFSSESIPEEHTYWMFP